MADVTIVVVEDDRDIADLVELYFRREGWHVHVAGDASSGIELARARRPDLVVADVGLPGELDGLDLCRSLRSAGDVPIILLTARDGEVDRVLGLELGADDYVTKPFSPRELVARVKAILRRAAGRSADDAPAVLRLGELEVDVARHEARAGGTAVALTAREFDLLAHLAAHAGVVLTRRQLLDGVWGVDWVGDERTVDVHVGQLRKKLGDALDLTTVFGVGYRLG